MNLIGTFDYPVDIDDVFTLTPVRVRFQERVLELGDLYGVDLNLISDRDWEYYYSEVTPNNINDLAYDLIGLAFSSDK